MSCIVPSTLAARRRIRILYAEDLRELRDVARILLDREGHHIDCADDGSSAWEELTAQAGGYDLLLTDHHMPHMTGLELVRRARAMAFPGRVMVFSSELNPAVAAAYQELGVDRLLFKPVHPATLRQAIQDLFPAASNRRGI